MDEQMMPKRYWDDPSYQKAVDTGIRLGRLLRRAEGTRRGGARKFHAIPRYPRHA